MKEANKHNKRRKNQAGAAEAYPVGWNQTVLLSIPFKTIHLQSVESVEADHVTSTNSYVLQLQS